MRFIKALFTFPNFFYHTECPIKNGHTIPAFGKKMYCISEVYNNIRNESVPNVDYHTVWYMYRDNQPQNKHVCSIAYI